jgi:DNA-binding MarR family transcriptional regulator
VEEAAALMRRLRALAAQVSGSGTLSAGPRKLVRDLQRLGPRTVPQLARARSVSRQHVQALVSQLAHGGYVEFAANPAHRRSPLVRLTRRGEEQSAEMRRQEAELLDSLEIALEGDELLRAAAVLRVVREAVERRAGRGAGPGDAATAANSDA